MKKAGFVSLVGAGPGDPELLTMKAFHLLKKADVVIYDHLVSDEILDLIPASISRISVAKSPGNHCVSQKDINDMIVQLARSGRFVVRLKGGDPYMFGRGGEEALKLKQHGIAFEIVPGITSASGCSTYSGIPLTHRGMSRGVKFITGHFSNNEPLDINWKSAADPDTTLVIYMGLANITVISESLIKEGLAASTPAAVIENGTMGKQHRVITNLKSLADAVALNNLNAPVMIIIGKVVSLAKELDWFQYNAEETDYGKNKMASL